MIPLFEYYKVDFNPHWERCSNCDRQYPGEEDFQLVSYWTFFGGGHFTDPKRVCNECATPRNVYFGHTSDTYSATTYENHEMICGFGPTEPAALMDLRERFSERFNRDIVNIQRG